LSEAVRSSVVGALGCTVARLTPLSGGCVGEVYRVDLGDGRRVVAKVDACPEPRLHIEGAMLQYLAAHSLLPVPGVLHTSPELLLMTWVDGSSSFSEAAQRHAAELLAGLHAITAPRFGFESPTLIGGLHQPNTWTERWVDFFREQRLLHMAREALKEGQLPRPLLGRIERLAARLEDLLEEPKRPSLLHGDVWTTNVLAQGEVVTGFLDPAVYYGHPEIELAFITLFSTFGDPFFWRYQELRPISPGFFEVRRDLYNLYPLLVHVRLFGASYLQGIERTLARHGV
jgi:fructosamine-3-kinase